MASGINEATEIDAQVFNTHLAQHAFGHRTEIDIRTGTVLFRHGVLKSDPAVNEDDHLIGILLAEDHADRVSIPPGPIIAHYSQGTNRTEISYIPTNLLLLS